jgi:hypothetical protein
MWVGLAHLIGLDRSTKFLREDEFILHTNKNGLNTGMIKPIGKTGWVTGLLHLRCDRVENKCTKSTDQ